MIFSFRGRAGYRDDANHAYRFGFADSADGLSWEIRNDEIGLERASSGWDSVMMTYAAFHGNHLFYNGNGFGATGIGVALRVH